MTHFGLGRYTTRDGHTAVIIGTVQGVTTAWPLVGYVVIDEEECGHQPCCWSCAGLAGLLLDLDPFDLAAPLEQTGCDCCDPTSSGEEPVVVRLERENAALRAQMERMEAEVNWLRAGIREYVPCRCWGQLLKCFACQVEARETVVRHD